MAAIGPKEFCDHKMQMPSVQNQEAGTDMERLLGQLQNPNLPIIHTVTLAAFREMSGYTLIKDVIIAGRTIPKGANLRQELIAITELEPAMKILNQRMNFDAQLNAAPSEILQKSTLHDLQEAARVPNRFQYSIINIALIEENIIAGFSLNHLDQIKIRAIELLAIRVDFLFKTSQTFCDLVKRHSLELTTSTFPSWSVAQFRALPPSDIPKVQRQISDMAWFIVSDEQFKQLDFSLMSQRRIGASFTSDIPTCARRVDLCSEKQFQQLIQRRALPNAGLKLMSDATISRFPWDNLTRYQIERYLCSNDSSLFERNKDKVAFVPMEMVRSLVTKRLVGKPFLSLLSDSQIEKFDIQTLAPDQREDYFASGAHPQQRKKIATIPQATLNEWLPTLSLSIFIQIPDDQIKELDVTQLTELQIKSLFPPVAIPTLFSGVYSREENGQGIRHFWRDGVRERSIWDKALQPILSKRRESRLKYRNLLGPEKTAQIQAKIPNYEELVS